MQQALFWQWQSDIGTWQFWHAGFMPELRRMIGRGGALRGEAVADVVIVRAVGSRGDISASGARRRVLARVGPGGTAAAGVPTP